MTELYGIFLQSTGVTTDTRNVALGQFFFALRGNNFDGNRFAQEAIDKGAKYAVVDDPELTGDRFIQVPDTTIALQQLAAEHRRMLSIPVIGITGTNGKTTTKELLHAVLSKKYNVLATIGNLNNHIGVPLTLLRLTPAHELAIIEMGASRAGDIAELADIAAPNYGLITNIGRAHLEGFGSYEGVIKTKGELFDYLREHGGKAFVPQYNPVLVQLSQGIETILYDNVEISERESEQETLCVKYCGDTITTNLIGKYNLDNVAGAITVARYFGVPTADITQAIEAYQPRMGRSQLLRTARNSVIVDAYNANPTSMKASLTSFCETAAKPLCVILGDMKELGQYSEEEHERIVALVKKLGIDKVIYVGECFMQAASSMQAQPISLYKDVHALRKALEQKVEDISGYTVLLKGSNSINLQDVTELL